jgi:hypothetical protein
LLFSVTSESSAPRQDLIVVVGAPGTAAYGDQFLQWSSRWEQAATQGNVRFRSVGRAADAESDDRLQLQQLLAAVDLDSPEPLWLVFIGHGTFDGKQAKFNLRGPDVTAQQLQEWLQPITRPTVLINCASASGPFISRLSGPNRIVVTATKHGNEQNFARFGDHLSAAITDLAADLDKDEQVSLLEATLAACSRVADWYQQEARLATEHALLDDNGDGLGTPADWYRGLRATRSAKNGAAVDGLRANQVHLVRSETEERLTAAAREMRDQLEEQIEQLRQQKPKLDEDAYYDRLEPLFLEVAALYTTPDP